MDLDIKLLAIPDSPGYYAGADGCIYSTLRRNGQHPAIVDGKAPAKLRSFALGRSGYLGVNLHCGNKQTTHHVHILILNAFHGERTEGTVACHNNGVRTDNRPCNLRWDTRTANEKDKEIHGTLPFGESHSRSRLTEDQVRRIRLAKGKQRDIAAAFGVSQSTISVIKRGETWKRCV